RYLLIAFDPDNAISESDELNNVCWIAPDTGQPNYDNALDKSRPLPANPDVWKIEANKRIAEMQAYLGPDYPFHVGRTVDLGPHGGGHKKFEKMDVSPRGNTSWEQLALAASKAGFWVHGEGVILAGTYWDFSPNATGQHLDLSNIRPYTPETGTSAD